MSGTLHFFSLSVIIYVDLQNLLYNKSPLLIYHLA
uniref:Uncharacterized protein n=1 Tax=Anguilla anguilla TaxID=7936 RepID=A0A0E9QVA6_ANGAN